MSQGRNMAGLTLLQANQRPCCTGYSSSCTWLHLRKTLVYAALAVLLPAVGVMSQDKSPEQPAPGLPAQAREPGQKAPAAFLVQVPLPIEGNVDGQVKSRMQQVLKSLKKMELSKEGPRPAIILEFIPKDGTAGEQSNFGRSLELAQFLTSDQLSPVRTIAYLPRSVKGH